MDKIVDYRNEIDVIDDKIMSLLEERFNLSEIIGNIKSASKYNVLDTNREQEILSKASKYSRFPQISSVYQSIFTQSKSLQRK